MLQGPVNQRSRSPGIQFIGQNASYAGIYKDSFTLVNDWIQCSSEFTVGESNCRKGHLRRLQRT